MDTAVCTLAVGKHRFKETYELIETYKKHTSCEVYVYTDTPELLDYNNVIDLKTITNAPLFHQNVFNYNLKGIVSENCYATTNHDRIIYADCDTSVLQDTDILETHFDDCDIAGIHGKFVEAHFGLPPGLKYLAIKDIVKLDDADLLKMKYFNEAFLIFNRSPNTDKLLKIWGYICETVSTLDVNPYPECVEFGIATYLVNDLKIHNLVNGVLKGDSILVTQHRRNTIGVVRR